MYWVHRMPLEVNIRLGFQTKNVWISYNASYILLILHNTDRIIQGFRKSNILYEQGGIILLTSCGVRKDLTLSTSQRIRQNACKWVLFESNLMIVYNWMHYHLNLKLTTSFGAGCVFFFFLACVGIVSNNIFLSLVLWHRGYAEIWSKWLCFRCENRVVGKWRKMTEKKGEKLKE